MSERSFTHASFTQYLAEHHLMGSRCARCGAVYLPPRPMCATCHTCEMEWMEFSGAGRVTGFSTIYSGPSFMIEAGFNRENPFCAGVIRLDEGPSISGQLLGFNPAAPEQLEVGLPVQASFVERGPAESRRTYLAFEAISTPRTAESPGEEVTGSPIQSPE